MYGFLLRPKWIGFHLLVVAGAIVMVNLGLWQLNRLENRQEFNRQVISRIDEPTVPLDQLLAESDDPQDLAWRPTVAVGTYLTDGQFVVVNRSQNGRAGDNAVVPMRLADGQILLVNRGFVPIRLDTPEAPTGTVEVRGIARPSEERRLGQLSDPATGRLEQVQRIDIDRLAMQLPGPVVPIYLDLLVSDPPEPPGIPEPVIRPDLSEGPHLAYAVQWFIFSAAVIVGWVLAVRWSVTKRREGSSTNEPSAPADGPISVGAGPAEPTDPPPSTGDGSATAPR